MCPARVSPPARVAAFAGRVTPGPLIAATHPPFPYPDGTNRPHMISGEVMAYTDGGGVAQTVTLQPLPSPGSTFGTGGGAYYDPRGFVQINAATTIDGYDFSGVGIGPVLAGPLTVSRCWFHNIDGQDSWAVWVHAEGTLDSLTVSDCLVQGTSPSVTGPDGILKMDGTWTNVVVKRCHTFNCSSAVQFAPITGPGTIPYGNQVTDNYFEANSDPSNLGLHLEQVNVSAGTGGLLVQHNHITGPAGQTASIYMSHDFGDVGNVIITDNLLDGLPQNTIYGGDTGSGPPTGGVLIAAAGNVQITSNKFANTAGQNPGGYVIEPAPGDSRLAVTGNVYWPSLAPVPGM